MDDYNRGRQEGAREFAAAMTDALTPGKTRIEIIRDLHKIRVVKGAIGLLSLHEASALADAILGKKEE